jgi:hypothetical protein
MTTITTDEDKPHLAPRPKLGETLDSYFPIPDWAFLPLTDEELKEWGL